MPRKRKRSSSSADAGKVHTWEQLSDDEDATADGATGLEEHLLRLYAAGSLTAKAFCIACHWACEAGVKSDSLSRYRKKPCCKSGEFSKHLKKHLPSAESAPELHQVEVPVFSKGSRSSKVSLMAPPHEVLNAELARMHEDGTPLENPSPGEWADTFEGHPHRHRELDERPVFPVALYVDGVKFTRSIGPGRADSVIVFTCYNLCTNKRHLLAVLSKRELCKCGCKGWDTIWNVMNYLRWSFTAAAEGVRPRERWDGEAFAPDSISGGLHSSSPRLGARFLLSQVKGDWSEYCSTFGFPTWQSHWRPCLYCSCTRRTMFDFSHVCTGGHGWGGLPDTYEDACRKSEININVDSEEVRKLVLEEGGLRYDKRKKGNGLVIQKNVPTLGLRKWDRLDPNCSLPDTAHVYDKALPFVCSFWRCSRDKKGRSMDRLTRRNPIFCEGVGVSPETVLHTDTLHTLYLGIFARYVFEVLMTAIEEDIWGIGGTKDERTQLACRRLLNDFKTWAQDPQNAVPLSYQIRTLTPKMLGSRSAPALKTKAAETGVLTRWAVEFCRTSGASMSRSRVLMKAGECLLEYAGILKESPRIVEPAKCERLLFLCLRHLALMGDVGGGYLPKAHMWVHMTLKIPACGNPRSYSTFHDESLNLVLAGIAASAHRSTWERTIFQRLRLLPLVDSQSAFAVL